MTFSGLFHSAEKHEGIFDRIRYLIMIKCKISDVYFHKYAKIKINWDDDLPLEKMINIHNVVMLI